LSHTEGLVTAWGLGIRLVRRIGYGFLPSASLVRRRPLRNRCLVHSRSLGYLRGGIARRSL
jgi:hypothetical protein